MRNNTTGAGNPIQDSRLPFLNILQEFRSETDD